ncbi:hypothetical protein ACQ4PT_063793 [Festuca glaucescens]
MLIAVVLTVLLAGAWCACAPPVTFTLEGSIEKNLALRIKYNKQGEAMAAVELEEHNNMWLALVKGAGVVWQIKSDKLLKARFDLRFITEKGMRNFIHDFVWADFSTIYSPEE